MNIGGMDFSAGSLIAGFVFGVFGIFIFREGKRDANLRRLAVGLTLMSYTFFVSNAWACWGIGLALVGISYFTNFAR